MLLFIILKEKKTAPQDFLDANTIPCWQQKGGSSSHDNHSGGLFNYWKNPCKNGQQTL